jgi:3-methyladenine DNA glycosylase AlkD
MIDDPALVTERQMESWALEFDSWDIVDGTCGTLFDQTPFAWTKAVEWSARDEEFVKRAGFVLMATLAVHDRFAADERFEGFLRIVEREAGDRRNFVRKAVNWALRQIGKRNETLHETAVETARRIVEQQPRGSRWVGMDALRELSSDAVIARLKAAGIKDRAARSPRARVRRDPTGASRSRTPGRSSSRTGRTGSARSR